MMCKMLVPVVILLTSLIVVCVNGDSPVFLWGNPSEQKPALHTVSQNEFVKIMKPKLEQSMIVVFLESELNTNDFRVKTADSESSYSNLKKFPDYTYFTSVNKPVDAFRELSMLQEHAIVNKDGHLEPAIEFRIGKIVFIDLKNVDGDRSIVLKKHDETIGKIYQQLSTKGKITGVYTSSRVAESRIRRATANKKQEGKSFTQQEFLLYYTKLIYKEADKDPVEVKISNMNVASSNDSHLSVKLSTDRDTLSFDIFRSHGYYMMKNLKLSDQTFHVYPSLEAPIGYSYVCGNREFMAMNTNKEQSSTSKIIWNGFQMEARFGKAQEKALVFDEGWDCSGFFSPGILSGLFVVFMLLIILGISVAWLMDINTMDRFENNRSGKTITVNATD